MPLPVAPNEPPVELGPRGSVLPPDMQRPVDPVPVTRQIIQTNPVAEIDNHVATGNFPALNSFAQRYTNTAEGQATYELAKKVENGQAEYRRLMDGVDPNTPEGRLKALQTYKTVKDEPRYGDAMMMYMAGDKIGAMQTIMGGKVETKIEYLPTTGRMVIKKVNALGQPVSVEDAESGQIIPMPEYAKLGGSVSALENTLKYQSDKETQAFRTKAFNNSTSAYNGLTTLANAKDPILQTYTSLMEEIMKNPQIDMNDRKLIAGFTSGQTSMARSLSTGRQLVDSATATKGNSLSAEDRQALGLGTGPVSAEQLKAALSAHADYSLTDKAGNTYSAGTLAQLMDTKNIGAQLDRSYTQNKEALEQSTLINLYRDRPDLYAKIQMAFELNQQIQKINADAAAVHGNPLFTVPVTAAGFTDPTQKVLAQAVQEKFNVEATRTFNEWRKQQMLMAKQAGAVDYVPEPGELESEFTKTPLYKKMQKDASKEIAETINRKPVFATTSQIPTETLTIGAKEATEMKSGIPAAVSPSAAQNRRDALLEANRSNQQSKPPETNEEAKRKERERIRAEALKEHTKGK